MEMILRDGLRVASPACDAWPVVVTDLQRRVTNSSGIGMDSVSVLARRE